MQKRSSSEKSEYEYNIDLAKYFLSDNSFDIASTDNQCMMVKNEKTVSADKRTLFLYTLLQVALQKLCRAMIL